MRLHSILLILTLCLASCGAKSRNNTDGTGMSDIPASESSSNIPSFDADSAYCYLAMQVKAGPRVPNTEAHKKIGNYLSAELKRHGANVIEQTAALKAFDGTMLSARNIFGEFNPDMDDRLLLVAHYDCRPWADQDPDPEKHRQPVEGANDGASGTALLLEIARQLSLQNPQKGIDILFVDAEDWGEENNDDSWAMGARYFINNPIKPGYLPSRVIVADMVGGKNAKFPIEYFSQQNSPDLTAKIWNCAVSAGYGDYFPKRMGGAITDDHVEFIKAGIPAIDIIEYHEDSGFDPDWHTSHDTLENIDKATLKAVGSTLLRYIYE